MTEIIILDNVSPAPRLFKECHRDDLPPGTKVAYQIGKSEMLRVPVKTEENDEG